MSNFEDYLNDYSLNSEEQDEQLDPPQFSSNYYDDSQYSSSYSDDVYEEEPHPRRYEEPEEYFEDDEEPVRKKGFKMPYDFNKFESKESSARSGGSGSNGGNSKLLLILVAASLLISIVSFTTVKSVQKSVEEMGSNLSSQITSLAAQTSELASRVSAIESGVQTTTAAIATPGTSKYITITKQPTSVTSHIGRGNGQDGDSGLGLFFSIEAKGNGLTYSSFVWQRQDPTGQWINVGFDGVNSKCDAYGLQNEVGKNDDGTFFSKIYTYGLTSSGFGQYRCVVSDATGEQAISEIVEIRNDG